MGPQKIAKAQIGGDVLQSLNTTAHICRTGSVDQVVTPQAFAATAKFYSYRWKGVCLWGALRSIVCIKRA